VRISRIGNAEGFVTGYYEPIVEGSRTQTPEFPVPLYRKPDDLISNQPPTQSGGFSNVGQAFRKVGEELVPYHDRGAIEDGALANRKLEICWLRDPIDLFFAQIQGSVRVRLTDGAVLRLNYDAHNGHPYTAIGRFLVEREIIPRDEMSMDKLRQWMSQNPEQGKELRRQNRSFVFFREAKLADDEEALGAQGIPLVTGRSIAVDRKLHAYGTPFWIDGELPTGANGAKERFRRLMIAQDTGSAIVGPARADIYFGAGLEAGTVSGRIRHPGRFIMLIPNTIRLGITVKRVPSPRPRP
jgi:membrane-bound lytic murein transglycosylase A